MNIEEELKKLQSEKQTLSNKIAVLEANIKTASEKLGISTNLDEIKAEWDKAVDKQKELEESLLKALKEFRENSSELKEALDEVPEEKSSGVTEFGSDEF